LSTVNGKESNTLSLKARALSPPFDKLRANGKKVKNIGKKPFVLSPVEARTSLGLMVKSHAESVY
jgi:hypothetical protein